MSAVTSLGAVSGFGLGVDALVAGALEERTALRAVRRFSTEGLRSVPAALVPGFDEPRLKSDHQGRADELAIAFAVAAGREALGDRDPADIGLVVGTNLEETAPISALVDRIAAALGLGGPRAAVSTACASGATALALGSEWVERGVCSRVLAGGTDVITPTVYAGFQVLGAMSEGPCRPYDDRRGMGLGDGAAFCLLEASGGPRILGWGTSADGHHPTQPAPDGRGVQAALRAALEHAGVDGVDHVHTHGTGTTANDNAELRGIFAALDRTLCSSSKGMLGHTQGAAGALEVVLSLALAARGRVPGTVGLQSPRAGVPDEVLKAGRSRRVDRIASTNSAFGGLNIALLLGEGPIPTRRCRRVTEERRVELAPDARPQARGFDPRRLDPSALLLIAAVNAALGGRPVRRGQARRIGLVVDQPRVPATSLRSLRTSIEEGGAPGLHAAAFANALRVAPTGACTRALGLRGPTDVLCGGLEVALAHAHVLAEERDLDAVVCASVDEDLGARSILLLSASA